MIKMSFFRRFHWLWDQRRMALFCWRCVFTHKYFWRKNSRKIMEFWIMKFYFLVLIRKKIIFAHLRKKKAWQKIKREWIQQNKKRRRFKNTRWIFLRKSLWVQLKNTPDLVIFYWNYESNCILDRFPWKLLFHLLLLIFTTIQVLSVVGTRTSNARSQHQVFKNILLVIAFFKNKHYNFYFWKGIDWRSWQSRI